MIDLGILKIPYSECTVSKEFQNNGLFTATGVSKLRGKVSLSAAYVNMYINQHGRLPWRVVDSNKCSYTSVLFRFVHTGLVYKKSTNNMDLGFRRQICVREASRPGFDALLCANHTRLNLGVFTRRRFRGLMWKVHDILKSRIKLACRNLFKDAIDDVRDLSELPHDKRELRMNAYAALDNDGLLLSKLFMDHVRIKLKVPEFAKAGKYPRTIGDFSTEGSLLGGHVTPILKAVFAETITLDGDTFRFVEKPSPEVLNEIFSEHFSAKGNVYTFHSDDNMITIQCADGSISFNLDISSCDISNGSPIFNFLLSICDGDPWLYNIVKRLIEQCRQDAVVRNPIYLKEKFKFKTGREIEFSGSLLTTTLNNIGSLLISLAINYYFKRHRVLKVDAATRISECAQSIGYIVTVEPWACVEDSQFLKYSWSRTVGLVFNMGPLIRSLGSCDGDAPRIRFHPKATVSEKLWEHAKGVMRGTAHYGNNSILHALRVLFNLPSDSSTIDDNILFKRYGLNGGEVEGLAYLIGGIRPGMYINHPAITKIMTKDYGYSPP